LPSQKRFHESKARFKGFSGPIGSGKSQALCQEAIRLSYLNPGRMGLLGAPTFPMLRDATQATLFEILDGNGIPYDHNKGENTLVMKETRSKIVFRAVDEFERLRGTNLAWFGLDELTYTQEEAWLRLEGRLRDPKAKRLCGFAVWTPKGYEWVYRKFVVDSHGAYVAILASPFENRFLLDRIPDYYDRLKTSYDETFYMQEALGSYLNLTGGKVYSSFSNHEHVRQTKLNPKDPLLWSLDFNVNPMCSIVAQSSGGHMYVLDEIVLRNATTMQACEEFLKRFGGHKAGVIVYGDASGYHQQTTGTSDYDIVTDYFNATSFTTPDISVANSNPPVRDRINRVNATLKAASGQVGLTIDPKCTELIEDLVQVAYKSDGNTIDKDRDRQRTHLSDALGYLLCQHRGGQRTVGLRGSGRLLSN